MSKLLGDTQSQEVSENSIAIQAGRDLNLGLSYRDVRDICIDLLEANYPVLREEAKKVSIQYVEEFGEKFFERLRREDPIIVQEKFRDPDVQAAINTSVIHVARMTEKSHQDILCELIAEKIKTPEEEKNLILNDAIEVMTKITKNQILFLVFIYCLRSIKPFNLNQKGDEINLNEKAMHDFFEIDIPKLIGDEIYKIDKFLLSHKGLILSDSSFSYKISLADYLTSKTNILLSKRTSTEKLNTDCGFNKFFPNISTIIRKFGFETIEDFDSAVLTPIGKEITAAYFKNNFRKLLLNKI